MNTPYLTFDPARPLNLFFRIARAGSKKFVFTDTEDVAFDISSSNWELNIKASERATTNIIQFATPTGIIVGGADNNEITFAIDETQSNLSERIYYWELYNASTKKTWLHGQAYFYKGVVDNADSVTEIIVDLGETTVNITVQDSISSINGGTP